MRSDSSDSLARYRAKRTLENSPEPTGEPVSAGAAQARRFVVQQHAARRLHWDLRMEVDGVLKSWAVPNGPSRDPAEKRLAVHVEDHPLEYADFEGVIPAGNYGAGAMIVWDQGVYVPLHDMREGLETGKLLFDLRGHKLRGTWTLVKMKKTENEWLLIKERDTQAAAGPDAFAADSVFSGLTVEELGSGEDPAEPLRAELERLDAPRRIVDPRRAQAMLAESRPEPFSRQGWVFEFKYDGYRTLAFREDDDVRLLTRRGNDLARAFPDLVRALSRLPFRRFLVDGEIVVHDELGLPSFQRLQRRAGLRRAPDVRRAESTLPATLWLFDLLAFEDRDTRELPLVQRKELLRRMVPSAGTLRYSDHVEEHGEALFRQAEQVGLEGVIGKRSDAPYRGGRSADWIKVRALRTDDFVVVGFTRPKRGRPGFGALHLGQYRDGDLRWTGSVGTGFDERQLRDIRAALDGRRSDRPPAVGAPKGAEHSWVEPELVAEVRYLERTEEGYVRQPVFLRLRDDKAPGECVWAAGEGLGIEEPEELGIEEPEELGIDEPEGLGIDEPERLGIEESERLAADGSDDTAAGGEEAKGGPEREGPDASLADRRDAPAAASAPAPPAERRAVRFSNLDKVFWPEDGYTKGDLIAYYESVSEWILPYLRDRPVVLTRFPDGIHGKSFFQKDAPSFAPSWLRTVTIRGEGGERDLSYFVCDDVPTLLYLANSATIPLHVWASRVESLDRPDWCILDLDPKEAPFEHVVEVARAAKVLCDELELPAFIKTSGSSGLHLLLPLARLLTHDQSKALGELLARVLVAELPKIATIVRSPARRGGKVYVDYLQNGRGKLLVAPLCVRPLPGAPVSTPLRWSEVTPSLDIRRFTIRSVPRRLRALKKDPLLALLTETPDLLSVLERLHARL